MQLVILIFHFDVRPHWGVLLRFRTVVLFRVSDAEGSELLPFLLGPPGPQSISIVLLPFLLPVLLRNLRRVFTHEVWFRWRRFLFARGRPAPLPLEGMNTRPRHLGCAIHACENSTDLLRKDDHVSPLFNTLVIVGIDVMLHALPRY